MLITVEQIPQEWKDVLHRVQNAFPGALIAGGALRDLDHGKPVKDVDIFIPINSNCPVEYLLQQNIPESTPHILNSAANNPDRIIYSIYHLKQNGVEYELIFASTNACNITTFDINLCQISFDGTTVYRTQEYMIGWAEQVIRFINPQSLKRMKERSDRIKVKYPEYKIQESVLPGMDGGY